MGACQIGLQLLGTSIRFVMTRDHVLQLLFDLPKLHLHLLLLLGSLLEVLCELDDLVLQLVRDLLEFGNRTSLGLERLEFLTRKPPTNARLQVNNVLDVRAEGSPRQAAQNQRQSCSGAYYDPLRRTVHGTGSARL